MATILTLAKIIVWKKEKSANRLQFLLVLLSQLFINVTFLFWNMVNESESVDYSTALIGIHSNKIYITTFLFSLVLSGAYIKQSWFVKKLKFVFLLCGIVIPFIFVITFNILPENKNNLKCESHHSNLRNNFPTYLSLFTTIVLLPMQAFCLIKLVSQNNQTEDDLIKISSSNQTVDVETQNLLQNESKFYVETMNNNKTHVSNYGSNCDHLHPSLSNERFDDTKDECEKGSDMQLKEETVIEITKANDSQLVDPSTNLNSVYFFLIMIFGGLIEIILCQWNLSNDNISGIYVILLYLHLIFVYGQGLLTFLFFFNFSETKEMIRCILNRSRRPSRSDYLEL